MTTILKIGGLIKGLDPLVAALVVAVIIIGSYNGWDLFTKKKHTKELTHRLMLIWSQLFELANKKTRIIYYCIMTDQMRVVESRLEEFVHIFKDVYSSIKKENGSTANTLVEDKDFKTYQLLLYIVRDSLKADIRTMLTENHLIEKSEEELQIYIREQYNLIVRSVTDLLNDLYISNEISREYLHSKNMEENTKTYELFSSIIRNCRQIAIQYNEDIKRIDRQVEGIIYRGEIGGPNDTIG